MKKKVVALLLLVSLEALADPGYNPYNQQLSYNQNFQYGSTNWFSSALGTGVAQAGILLVGGLVNAMSRPDPVIVTQQSAAPGVAGGRTGPSTSLTSVDNRSGSGNCAYQTLYDQQGHPVSVRVCP